MGERTDIHPANKQEVGRRLARAAETIAYGSDKPVGPEVVRAHREDQSVVLEFKGVTGSLRSFSGARLLAFELCGDLLDSCRFADAVASGSSVRIALDGRSATRVRYAWAGHPVTNLYDEAVARRTVRNSGRLSADLTFAGFGIRERANEECQSGDGRPRPV